MRNIFRFILFCRIIHDPFCSIEIKITTLRQIRFHVCIKMRRCKRRVCKRKTLFGQPNSLLKSMQTNVNEINVRSIFTVICNFFARYFLTLYEVFCL